MDKGFNLEDEVFVITHQSPFWDGVTEKTKAVIIEDISGLCWEKEYTQQYKNLLDQYTCQLNVKGSKVMC